MGSVSFGSTFKVNGGSQNYVKQNNMIDFCENNDLEYISKFEVQNRKNSWFSEPVYREKTSIIAPDSKDSLVETYLKNKGIKFNKLDTKDLLNSKKINSRIEDAPHNKELVRLDVKKFEKLISNQDNNITHCESDYNKYYRDSVDLMIKSGDKLPATTLHIIPSGESVDDAVNYIKKYGADRLNDDQLLVMFTQNTDDPDQCMYFGMKDLGMDEVPVYVDKETCKLCNALDILK